MHVVPDLLPDLRPTLDLRLNFPEPPPKDVYRRSRVKRRYQKVDAGMYLLPEQVWVVCLDVFASAHDACTIDMAVTCAIYDCMAYRHTTLYAVHGRPRCAWSFLFRTYTHIAFRRSR